MICQRKGLHEYYNMGTKNLIFFSKKFEIEFDLCWRAEINIQVGLTYMATSGMHRYPFWGSTSSWYINGIVFTSTTPWKPENLIFFFQKSLKFKFWLLTKSWNHLSFVNISPTLVLIHQWNDLHEYYTMETNKCENFSKSSKLNSVRTPSFRMPRNEIALASSISVLRK